MVTFNSCMLGVMELLQELGATKEKLQATETRLKALETSQQELMSKHANSEVQIEKIKMEKQDLLQERRATKEKLQATETRLKALETSQQTKSRRNLQEMKSTLQKMLDRPKVAFSAALGVHGFFGPVYADTTLVYKNVFMNVGNAYQQTTGIFIAPVRGVYYFSFFYHCGTQHGTWLNLYRNGKKEAMAGQHKTQHGTPANGGNGSILLLEKGDRVYIVLQKNSWIWDADNVTVFSGFLFNAM